MPGGCPRNLNNHCPELPSRQRALGRYPSNDRFADTQPPPILDPAKGRLSGSPRAADTGGLDFRLACESDPGARARRQFASVASTQKALPAWPRAPFSCSPTGQPMSHSLRRGHETDLAYVGRPEARRSAICTLGSCWSWVILCENATSQVDSRELRRLTMKRFVARLCIDLPAAR